MCHRAQRRTYDIVTWLPTRYLLGEVVWVMVAAFKMTVRVELGGGVDQRAEDSKELSEGDGEHLVWLCCVGIDVEGEK